MKSFVIIINNILSLSAQRKASAAVCIAMALCILSACKEENGPANLPPTVTVASAQDITRTSATLSGTVKKNGDGTIEKVQFVFGTSAEEETAVPCDPANPAPTVQLTNLRANTTYHYRLEAGNGHSYVQSTTLSFGTIPNNKPSVGNPQMLGQGPLSILLQCEITDDGGEPITAAGFYYTAQGGTEEKMETSTAYAPLIRAHIKGLKEHTTYTAQAYAANTSGETRSETFSFTTSQTILTLQPGMLSEIVDAEEKYLYNSIAISGPLNGTDIRFLREMLGKDVKGNDTQGRISQLDLTETTICEGGLSYNSSRYTANNVVGTGMFANCNYLQALKLPENAEVIEADAFSGCPLLSTVGIPTATTQILPSYNCEMLSGIEVSEANNAFHSHDGVLYSKDDSQLIWFPEGKEWVQSFPAGIVIIGQNAFRNSRMKLIELPSSIKEIKQGAFYGAQLEEIKLPESLEIVPSALFQDCVNLSTVTVGKNVHTLSDYCFDGCPLKILYVLADDFPPIIKENTFGKETFKTCVLYVPANSLSLYRNDNKWSQFDYIKAIAK